MKEDILEIKTSPDDIKCTKCIFAGEPFNIGCAKYKIKPTEVLYEGKDCEKFIQGEEEDE